MAVKTAQVIINGQTYNLTKDSTTGKYKAQVTAPSKSSYALDGHYYPVTVKAEDEAGNATTANDTHATLGSSLQLIVKEKVAPVIAITSPTAGQLTSQAKPQITWKVTDDDSGVNSGTIGLTIDSDSKITSGITKTAITGGYQCSYTPSTALADGEHTIKFDASDNDGNAAAQKSVTFRVLATAPNLSITSPVDGAWSKAASLAFTGETDAASLTVKVGSGTAQAVTITDGAFSGNVTLTAEGENTITFVATSESGVTTTVTRKVKLDTKPPVINSVEFDKNPVDAGATYTITVDITD